MKNLEKKLIRDVKKQAGKTIYDYALIQEGDRVLAGLSGGKDSLTMLDILAEKMKSLPIKFHLEAAYIELEDISNKVDAEWLEEFCRKRAVPFHFIRNKLDLSIDPEKDRCYLCALYRRKSLFDLARQLNCNKLALGHNLDDIVSTLLMNMSYNGNISTMPVKVSLFKGELDIIRPLGEVDEDEILKYAGIMNFNPDRRPCPLGEGYTRHKVKDLINELAKGNPHVKTNIFRSMKRIKTDYLS